MIGHLGVVRDEYHLKRGTRGLKRPVFFTQPKARGVQGIAGLGICLGHISVLHAEPRGCGLVVGLEMVTFGPGSESECLN